MRTRRCTAILCAFARVWELKRNHVLFGKRGPSSNPRRIFLDVVDVITLCSLMYYGAAVFLTSLDVVFLTPLGRLFFDVLFCYFLLFLAL